MTIRFTKYLKDAAVFKPMDERITIQGHYWKRTAYNEGEALDIMS